MRLTTVATAGLIFGAVLAPPAALAASGLDAYALSAGGNSILGAGGNPFSCATFGPDPRAAIFSGGGQVGLPTDGSICGVGVDSRSISGTGGSVQAASTLAVGFGAPGDLRSYAGSSAGRAGYGNLGASASGHYNGSTDSFTVVGSQAGARQTETMTFGGASGNGTYRATFTIDGSMFNVGRTYSELDFGYSSGAGPNFLSFRILDTYGTLSLYANGGYQNSLPGMTITGDAVNGITVAGSTTFSFDIPIVFGSATDITYTMWAAVLPSSSVGLLTGSGADVSFLDSAKLTGIQLLDSAGQALNTFTITSGSGTLYGPGGVVAVPETGTSMLMAVGLLTLGAAATPRRRRPRAISARARG